MAPRTGLVVYLLCAWHHAMQHEPALRGASGGSGLSHLHQDLARPCHICTGTGRQVLSRHIEQERRARAAFLKTVAPFERSSMEQLLR